MSDRSGIENIHLHRGKRTLALMFAMAVVLAALPASIFAQIQLDGNAKKLTCQAPANCSDTDWDEILLGGGGGAVAKTSLAPGDRPEPTFAQFTGGGSKDEQNIPNWRHRSGTPPAKDDISHAFAAAFQKTNGDLILAFGMDRYDTSGDAQLGFWFLNEDVKPIAGGTFSGQHRDNDLLVLVNFSGGGDTPTIQVFKWLNGGVQSLGIGGAVLCNGTIPGAGFCGITNSGPVDAPWPYENKDSAITTSFPAASFFEGGINLTQLGLAGCFTGFITESRSSTSITATLKDFVHPEGGFHLCGIDVTKNCSGGTVSTATQMITYDISGKVKNTGPGTLYNVELSDNVTVDGAFKVINCASGVPTGADFPLTSLGTGLAGEVCYKNTITVPLTGDGTSDIVTVTANSQSDNNGTAVSDSGEATCPNIQINSSILVSKDCNSSVFVDSTPQVVVRVNVSGQVCNTGDTNLTGVTVVDLGITTTPAKLVDNISLAPGACRNYSGSYIPTAAKDANGDNTSNPACVRFTDTVKASGKNAFNVTVEHTDMAECPLCGTCTPPPTP